jgi:2-C-methyl-D-erythritol 2,4-cyclodiphosphate synthase
MFVGLGYDVHRLCEGRPLFLGGVKIESPKGLMGHSDADVLLHALMDALLGAMGLDDIGHLFPNTDERYKGISSLKLLGEVHKKILEGGFEINNIDMTLIAEAPKIAPYIDAMKTAISETLDIKKTAVGIKATTNEKLGFIGKEEGMAAFATASLNKK